MIVPAKDSAIFSTRWGVRMVIAWLVGVVSAGAGLLFAQGLDISAGVCVALFLGIVLAVCATGTLLRRIA